MLLQKQRLLAEGGQMCSMELHGTLMENESLSTTQLAFWANVQWARPGSGAFSLLKQMLPRSLESFGLQCSRFSSNQQKRSHWKGPDGCAYQRETFSDSVKIGKLLKNCSHSQAKWLAIRWNQSCSAQDAEYFRRLWGWLADEKDEAPE